MSTCIDCQKHVPETRMSAFPPYCDVCQECEQKRGDGRVTRALDPNAWPIVWPRPRESTK